MYLIYVDESGDVGLTNSPTRFFVLSGLVVHELRWRSTFEAIVAFRRDLRQRYGLKLRDEIHAHAFIHRPAELARIPKSLRVRILRDVIDFQASMSDVSVLNVVVDKSGKSAGYNVFDNAWMVFLQRFHNTLSYRNFPGPRNPQDLGMLIADQTDEVRLRKLVRRLRRYNPVPHDQQYAQRNAPGYRQLLMDLIVEDPVTRDSKHSYFVQLADVNAFFLYQKMAPNTYLKKKGAQNYFNRLDPVLCKVASRTHPQGIVML